MPAPIIRWNYDELNEVAQQFDSEHDRATKVVADITRNVEVLRGGDWVGEAATKFYARMDGEVLPELKRLCNALSTAASTTRQISAYAKETEELAAKLLGRLRSMADTLGAINPGLAAALAGAIAGATALRKAALGNPSSAFNIMGSSSIAESESPKSIQIPGSFSKGMQDAWGDSFPSGKSHEQGGILVRKADGTYEWRRGKTDNGTSGSFKINREDVKPGETLIASGHTHPYDKSEGSHTNVPFSDADMANLVYNPEQMKMVQSGEGRFVLAKTQEFDALVTGKTDAEKTALYNQMKVDWNNAFDAAPGTFAEQNDAAVKAVAQKYHLQYYAGKGDTLNR